MRIYEVDLLHFGLNLTSMMKKSYQCKSEDIFRVQDLNVGNLNMHNSSLSTMNLAYFKSLLVYVEKVQKELEIKYHREITYEEVRNELRNRKYRKLQDVYEDRAFNK